MGHVDQKPSMVVHGDGGGKSYFVTQDSTDLISSRHMDVKAEYEFFNTHEMTPLVHDYLFNNYRKSTKYTPNKSEPNPNTMFCR